ncbi:hypothetical protein ABFS82_03G098400 [Erythranthe guttata]|uniref:Uncharacterized protein n=1 Tax=Erythranthe guttata TaxID=4155 RepID=A0A022Q2U9_ERYGU|nr:PREDICTED: uncharacterized protein LOC105974469 [Erythranthe guttata]EYU22972.1 hypothetical protein MIMGU_mgv1a014612mg [Erythranthe guttata]|eukprot:XP_012855030.1 PREDICTED: uncharacterized protein LOC105974469 [Erythranthe guttata]
MNELRDERRREWCYFHPKELVVGVCALCLNERLLLLLASQNQPQTNAVYTVKPKRALQKILALTNLLSRLDFKRHKTQQLHYSSSTSPEDSYISIKFEENGVASWDKGKLISTSSHEDKKKIKSSVVEHAKPAMRWRRRIGHLFQVIRWKGSSSSTCHVGTKVDAASNMVKYGWIRTLTKRRST